MGKTFAYTETIEMIAITCGECGVMFGMPKTLYDACRVITKGKSWGQTFYCPNGHSRGFQGESAEDGLTRELARAKQREAMHEDDIRWQKQARETAERRASAMKGQVTRLRNRASAGVCPCCNRTFAALHRHMQSKHPEYKGEPPELKLVEGGAA